MPLACPTRVPSLIAPGGTVFHSKAAFRLALGRGEISPAEIALEAEAQLARFAACLGRSPVHVDSHQHVHVEPGLYQVLAPLFKANGVGVVRIPCERVSSTGLCLVCSTISRAAAESRAYYRAFGLVSTECFVGLGFCGGTYTAESLADAVRAQPGSTCEIMTHPGLRGECMDNEFDRSLDREDELAVLCDSDTRVRLEAVGILSYHGRN
jgi:predicted glycoside hydrolase/deacetylase ChbG (UPF0249 family)